MGQMRKTGQRLKGFERLPPRDWRRVIAEIVNRGRCRYIDIALAVASTENTIACLACGLRNNPRDSLASQLLALHAYVSRDIDNTQ